MFGSHGKKRLITAALGSLLLIAASVGASQCPQADSEALMWLDKMSRSLNSVSYHGVVTLQRGDDMQVMQVSHRVTGDSSTENITELTGQGARVERDDHPLECVHPGQKLLQLGQDIQAGRCGIARYYRLSVGDGERVAGRRAVRIRIEPQDMYRFGYVMELDRETALLLKTETLGRGGQSLEKFQFADLSYSDRDAAGTDINLLHHAHHPLLAEPQAQTQDDWTVGWVPEGFTPTDTPASGVARRTYTDGLAVFSVFLENLAQGIRAGEGVVRFGGTTSYTRGMNITGRPVLVTVIGEVPLNTARMVADSVRWTH